MNYIVAASTDVGLTKNTNQDSYSIQVFSTPQGKLVFAVLCDGMGGLAKGELASATLVHGFVRWSQTRLPELCIREITDGEIREDWVRLVTEYNEKIKEYANSMGTHMGTTVTAMLLTQNRYYILNVGDSRAYEITQQAVVLTKDQTVVAREVELGRLTEEQAEQDPRRSVLLQCVGASPEVVPDLFFGTVKLNAVYMLCSDGFRHKISAQEIQQELQPDRMLSAEGMKVNMDVLIQRVKQREEGDNISVLTIRSF